MRTLLVVLICLVCAFAEASSESAFTAVLQTSVHNGRVNYPRLCKEPGLQSYLEYLSTTDPSLMDRKSQLAFWINAYNAYTLKIVCNHYPIKSINDLHSGGLIIGSIFNTTVWDKKFAAVNHTTYTLNFIEHKIIRPDFKEPRSHFALVCASKSCPTLRSEAYDGASLNEQLDDQARGFFSDTQKNYFEVVTRTAHLSKILDWYSKDFGKDRQEVLLFVAKFLPQNTAADIRSNLAAWKITYTKYDWALNDQPAAQ